MSVYWMQWGTSPVMDACSFPPKPESCLTVLLFSVSVHTDHLQQCQVSYSHVVKVYVWVPPANFSEVSVVEGQTVRQVVHYVSSVDFVCRLIVTVRKCSSKYIHSNDVEEQPDDQNQQQHVPRGPEGDSQGLQHHLQTDRYRLRQVQGLQRPLQTDRSTLSWCKCYN